MFDSTCWVCEREVFQNGCVTSFAASQPEKKSEKSLELFYHFAGSKRFRTAGGFLWQKKLGEKICNKNIQQKIHSQKQKDPTLEAPKWSLDVVVAAGKQAIFAAWPVLPLRLDKKHTMQLIWEKTYHMRYFLPFCKEPYF